MSYLTMLIVGAVVALGVPRAAAAETAQAVIQPTQEGSSVAGTVTLSDTPEGVAVVARLTGVPPGRHGFHIHQHGACGDGGQAAGGHYNPDAAPHGFLPHDGPQKAHAGDLGNLEIGPDGTGTLTATLPGVRVSGGPRSVGGRALILHAKADDFGQPVGNAGGRIGCGVIAITGE